jgi:hypothetical protein
VIFRRREPSDEVFVDSAGRLWLCFRLAVHPDLARHFPEIADRGDLNELRETLGWNAKEAAKALRHFRVTDPALRAIKSQLAKEVVECLKIVTRTSLAAQDLFYTDSPSELRLFMWRRLLELDSTDPHDAQLLGLRKRAQTASDQRLRRRLAEYFDSDPFGNWPDYLINFADREKCPRCASKGNTFAEPAGTPNRLKRCFQCGFEYRSGL